MRGSQFADGPAPYRSPLWRAAGGARIEPPAVTSDALGRKTAFLREYPENRQLAGGRSLAAQAAAHPKICLAMVSF